MVATGRFAEIIDVEFAEPFSGLVSAIEDRKDKIAKRLHDALTQKALVDQIKSSDYFGDQNSNRDYEVRMVLMRALHLASDPIPDFLSLALDDEREWYVRCGALDALSQEADKPDLLKVLPVIADSRLEGEIRQAALKAASRNGLTEALELITAADFDIDGWYDADLHLICERGYLGDASAIDGLLTLTVDDWNHRRSSALDALDALVVKLGGVEAVAGQLLATAGLAQSDNEDLATLLAESEDERVRIWALSQAKSKSPAFVAALIASLGFDSWRLQLAVSERLSELNIDGGPLRGVVADVNAVRAQRLWALRTLLRMGCEVSPELLGAIGDLSVRWDFAVDSRIRPIVIALFAAEAQPGTDVRYLIEYHRQEPPANFDDEAKKVELLNALRQEGHVCSEWEEAGEHYGSGSGEYWTINVGGLALCLNKWGPLSCLSGDPASEAKYDEIASTLARCDVTLLSDDQLANLVPGLNVYYFGDRAPLTLRQLLFYWQD